MGRTSDGSLLALGQPSERVQDAAVIPPEQPPELRARQMREGRVDRADGLPARVNDPLLAAAAEDVLLRHAMPTGHCGDAPQQPAAWGFKRL